MNKVKEERVTDLSIIMDMIAGKTPYYSIRYKNVGEDYEETYHLAEVPQDVYAMGLIAETKVDLPLQASRTDETEVGVIAAGSKIAFGATDNRNWVYAESMDGQVSGWFYVDDSDYPTMIRVSGEMLEADNVFANLMYAD